MDIAPLLTAGGLVTLLAAVIGYLLSANHKDRTQHADIVESLRKRLDSAEDRYNSRLDKLQNDHAGKIDAMETRIDNLEREVDTERLARQEAEMAAHQALLRANRAEYQLRLIQGGEGTGS